ncbi:hypothetical protein SCLCIDRAFT_121551 [Scleroderma citrinum Foug A]|uniref:Uncharacterized protein n=1 Tax=Scleroderma citrinum Foug A TaxID=1036808 RepID=A0A0C2ZJH1_9AGAM|nr:hypothetical protein SCLCIDRAFT_121551 [Scleroderma citrinum Foug A]
MDGFHTISIVLSGKDRSLSLRGSAVTGTFIACYQNAYLININAMFSPVWHNPCTPDFGHCECHNCRGGLIDIRSRIETYKDRLDIFRFDRSCHGSYFLQLRGLWPDPLSRPHPHLCICSMSFRYHNIIDNVTTIEKTAENLTSIVAKNVGSFPVKPKAT